MLSIFEKRCHVYVFAVRFMLFPSTLGQFFCCEVHFVAMPFPKGNIKHTSCQHGFNLYFLFIYLHFIIECSFNFYFKILFIFGMFVVVCWKALGLKSLMDILCYLFFILFNTCYMKILVIPFLREYKAEGIKATISSRQKSRRELEAELCRGKRNTKSTCELVLSYTTRQVQLPKRRTKAQRRQC